MVPAIPTGGNQVFLTRVLTPNNQANPGFGGAPGTFGGSPFDYFGITDRRINFDVADDSDRQDPDFEGDNWVCRCYRKSRGLWQLHRHVGRTKPCE